MPEVMLRRDWPNTFRRTIVSGKKTTRLAFVSGQPVELNAAQIEALKADIGVALIPCERDKKGKCRMITDDVEPEIEETNVANVV